MTSIIYGRNTFTLVSLSIGVSLLIAALIKVIYLLYAGYNSSPKRKK